MDRQEYDEKMNQGFDLQITTTIQLSNSSITEMIHAALGQEKWASVDDSRNEKLMETLGADAADLVPLGEKLIINDTNTGKEYELDKEKFIAGFQKWMSESEEQIIIFDRDRFQNDYFGEGHILQFALFGKILYK